MTNLRVTLRIMLFMAMMGSLFAQPLCAEGMDSLRWSHPIVQEKAYLHLDNNCYFAGDTIWYAAYVVRADDHRPTDMSRILYVELLDEQGYLMERQQLVVDYEGQAHGQFAIADSAWAGYYEVRAYTKWMLNWENETMFSRVVPVYEKPDSVENYRRKRIPKKVSAGNYEITYPLPKFKIEFYPEGGHLVEGLPSRVAFEVINEQTQNIAAKGVLLEDGQEVTAIRCGGGGRGVFSFTPKRGCRYEARFEHRGEKYVSPLPDIQERGYVLRVDGEKDSLRMQVVYADSLSRELALCVSCRGRVDTVLDVPVPRDGKSVVRLSKEGLAAGVHTVTLCNKRAKSPIASRMVFVEGKEEVVRKARVVGQKSELKPYGKVGLDIALGKDMAGQSFSLAVCDKGQKDESFHKGNIMTELLLASDVRGFIPNIDKLINDPAALDLLMMVQGWSRYNWQQMFFSSHPSVPRLSPEKGMIIEGGMMDLLSTVWKPQKGRKALFASLFLLDGNVYDKKLNEETFLFKGSMYADSLDQFRISYPPFYGDAILQLRGFYAQKLEKSTKYGQKLHDPHIFIYCQNFFPEDGKQYSWYEMNQPDSLFDRYASVGSQDDSISASILLDNVTVRQKRLKYIRPKLNCPVATYDFLDFVNEQWDRGRYDMNRLLDYTSEYSFLHHRMYAERFMRGVYSAESQSTVLVLLNHVYKDPCHNIDPILQRRFSFIHRMDKISFITDTPRRPAYYQLQHRAESCVTESGSTFVFHPHGYLDFTQLPDGQERFLEGRYIKLHGFNRPAEFYSPDYSRMPLPEVPDHRHTLYWNPIVRTDSEGRAHVEFYNSGVCTEIDVEVEGVAKDGRLIVDE